MKEFDLLHLTSDTDVEVLVNQVVFEEPLISEKKKPQLRRLIYKLIEKLEQKETNDFYLFKILRAHILPLTNCAFNKSGDKFITGSYDRTCKVSEAQMRTQLICTNLNFITIQKTPFAGLEHHHRGRTSHARGTQKCRLRYCF